MRIADIRKVNGSRDNIVFETCDRELFADFVMDYADKKATSPVEEGGQPDAEIIFEQNEEFSTIVNKSPVWFSFADVDTCKRQE